MKKLIKAQETNRSICLTVVWDRPKQAKIFILIDNYT